ncbi:carbon-nitrogen hydrolase [Sphingorhabdus lutea]|uniref:Carbon-nitrogen hydrolase n=1 Tax=Sphingorhabdus lutea TaxID=1913578 RepID=A0A1L3JBW4_9SPHN|nr:carbon-nitrogen hydrolase family protein [Sphingorhabdus lutea]APG62635.1 carbon-nitrogen hydrolase [Sphingorhabdus lutea]
MKVAVCQAAPIPFNVDAGIEKLLNLATNAIENGAKLIAFGETFLGGYPIWLDEAAGAALWDHLGTKSLHNIILKQAIKQDDPRLLPLQQLCDENDVMLSIGAHERLRNSIYNNQFLMRPKKSMLNHRKLVPTHGERLIWNRGDGSTLNVHQHDRHVVGNLICWEHWMPMARAVMHNMGETIHIAAWPTVRDTYEIASRHYAFEGRCFVLAAGTVQHRQDLLDGLHSVGGDSAAKELIEQMADKQLQFGGSMIIAPDASILAKAGDKAETIYADLDIDLIGQGLTSLDTDGHYSRADIFDLRVNISEHNGVTYEK